MDALSHIEIDPLLHQPVRTHLVAYLAARGEASFPELKRALALTDGNLDAHIKKLVAAKYVKMRKAEGETRPQTSYRLTESGRRAFEGYVDSLQRLLKLQT